MGNGANARHPIDDRGSEPSHPEATPSGVGAPLRSRSTIRLGRIRKVARQHPLIPSMSRPANPYDNASCESFMKTLKREEIYANNYTDLDHLRTNIEEFIEQYYNRCGCTRRWAIDPPKSSSNRSRRQVRPNREAQRWCFLRTKRTAERFRKDYWGKGLKCRPLPQTPSPARRCKNPSMKAETVSK